MDTKNTNFDNINKIYTESKIWNWSNLDRWANSVFGKRIEEMNNEERERVISYIIIKNENISFRWLVKDLAHDLNRDYNTKFRASLYNIFYENEKYNWTKENRTDLLHKLVFLIKVEKNIDLIKEKFGQEKNEIIKETKDAKKDLNEEIYNIPEKTKIHYSKKVSKEDLMKYKDDLIKLWFYKWENTWIIGKDFLEAVKSFQKSKWLVDDGRIWEKSAKALENEISKITNSVKKVDKKEEINPIIIKEEILKPKDKENKVEILSELKEEKRDIEKESEDILGLSEMKKFKNKNWAKENKILLEICENFLKDEWINKKIHTLFKEKFWLNYDGSFEQNKRLFTNLYLEKTKFDLRDYIEFLWMNYSDEAVSYLWKNILWNFSWSDLDKEKLLIELVYLYEFTNSDELEASLKWNKKSENDKIQEASTKVSKFKENYFKLNPPPALIKIDKPFCEVEDKTENKKTILFAPAVKSTWKIPGKCVVTARNTLNNVFNINNTTPDYEAPKWDAKQIIREKEIKGEILELTKDEAKNYMLEKYKAWESNVFEVYVKTKKRHIAIAFIWKDLWVYILDPYFNSWTTKPISIDEYWAFKNHKYLYISKSQDLYSKHKALATIAMK